MLIYFLIEAKKDNSDITEQYCKKSKNLFSFLIIFNNSLFKF